MGEPAERGSRRRSRRLKTLLNLYPPYLGAGVRVKEVGPGVSWFEVEMRLRWWNRNYVGTHFGGSLYTMCDPFFMLILIEKLGNGYVVWDKRATIHFLKPGRGTVRARFEIPEAVIEEIRRRADETGKVEPELSAEVTDTAGEVVARVDKLLYVRKKAPPG